MRKIKSNRNGITLIALVITIVVLIILASVAITLSLGDNGIFKKATKAKENTQLAQNEESMQIAETTNSIDKITGSSRDTVTISKDEYDKLKNSTSYSEEEESIGTWSDGKTLYRKVVTVNASFTNSLTGNLYSGTVSYNTLGISGADNVFVDNSKSYYTINNQQRGFVTLWNQSESQNVFAITLYSRSNATCTFTLEYTKTTD